MCMERMVANVSESIGISALEERIFLHEQQVSKLGSLYNNHAPVAKLPPELLSEIFLIQAANSREDLLHCFTHETDPYHRSFYKWIRVSHVCRHWREVALNCANLWTWIAFDQHIPVSYTRKLLRRTRDLPLTIVFNVTDTDGHCEGCINMDWFYDNFHSQNDQVAALLPRTRELTILVDKDIFNEYWDELLANAPGDILEVVRIEAFGSCRYRQLSLPPRRADVKVASEPFRGKTPSLRSLTLTGVEFGWSDTLFCPSLRHLELTSCQITEVEDRSELRTCLETLRSLSNLETLKLDWPLLIDLDHTGCKPVLLPNLMLLHIRADNPRMTTLLSFIRVPAPTAVRCTVMDSFFNEDDRSPFQVALSGLFDKMTIHTVAWGVPTEYSVRGDPRTICQIWAVEGRDVRSAEVPSSWDAVNDTLPKLIVESMFKPAVDVVVPAALRGLELSSVRMIHVAGCIPTRSWSRALKKAVNVECIRATGMIAFGLPATLAGGTSDDPPNDWRICLGNDYAGDDERHWISFDAGGATAANAHSASAKSSAQATSAPAVPDSAVDGGQAPVPPEEDAAAVPLSPAFPQLHTLQFVDLDIHIPDDVADWKQCYPRAPDIFLDYVAVAGGRYGLSISALLKSLRMRGEQRASPIERIDFEGCMCTRPELIAQLAEAGLGMVTWDGRAISGVGV